jgi:hypothetical protein
MTALPGALSTDRLTRPRVVEVDWRRDRRWLDFLDERPDALVYHHPGWLESLSREYGRSPVGLACVDAAGRVRGLMPLLETRGLPVPRAGATVRARVSSLPRTPLAGPIAESADAESALVEAALDRVRARPGLELEIKPARPGLAGRAGGLTEVPWRPSYVLHLPEPGVPLRFGSGRNHARIRWAVQKAQRAGVRLRDARTPADVRAWHRIYLDTMRRNLVPPRPLRLFLALWETLGRAGHMRLLLAERPPAGLIGGSVLLAFGQTVFYAFNAVHRDAVALRPNDLLQWQAIHDARDGGFRRYDLGEVGAGNAGLADFKRKWGGEEIRLHRCYHPPPGQGVEHESGDTGPKGRLRDPAAAVWQRVPLDATALAGDLVYRFL